MSFSDRTYATAQTSTLGNVDFSQVFETSTNSVRKSIDETLFVLKWKTTQTPSLIILFGQWKKEIMANEFIIKNGFHSQGNSQITGSLSVNGTSRTIFTTSSLVYSGSNVTQVTQSFGSTQQITDILYSGSFADGNPLSIAVTGSDGINKL